MAQGNPGALVRSMLALQAERRTGILEVNADGVRTFIYVREGLPVFAEEGTSGETLGRLLVRQRVLTQEQYTQVIDRMMLGIIDNEQMRFGEVAVELGFLSEEKVTRALGDQMRWKIIRAFQRETPEWTFADAPGEVETVGRRFSLPTESLVIEAARWFPVERKKEIVQARPLDHFATMREAPGVVLARFELSPAETQVVSMLDGSQTLRAIVAGRTPDEADVLTVLTALILTGTLQLGERRAAPTTSLAPPPVPPATGAVEPPRRVLRRPPAPPKGTARERAKEAVARLRVAGATAKQASEAPPPVPIVPKNAHETRLVAEQAFQKGKTHLQANRIAAAATELHRAAALEPETREYQLYASWVDVRALEGAPDEVTRLALKALAVRALREDPNLAFALYVLGHVALLEGDGAARKFFKAALDLDPEAIDAARHIRILARRKSAKRPDVAPVEREDAAPPPSAKRASPPKAMGGRPNPLLLGALGAVVVAAAIVFILSRGSSAPRPAAISVAATPPAPRPAAAP